MTIRARFPSALIIAICTLALVIFAAKLNAQSAPQQYQPSGAAPAASSQYAMPGGVPAQGQELQLAPPWVISPQEQAGLDRLLSDWEKQSNSIKTFSCKFTRLEYNPALAGGNPNQPVTQSNGELKYAAPDKGLFHVTDLSNFNPDPQQPGRFVEQKVGEGEYWTCDGKSIYEVNHEKKLVIEKTIPPQLQGKAITDGPLPFVFGAKADTLKKRYYLRIITPPARANEEVWLEAQPKLQKDAANFARVELILDRAKLQPTAIQIFNPGSGPKNQSRTVITLDKSEPNSYWAPIQHLFDAFERPKPFGYRLVKQQDLVPPSVAPQQSAGESQPAGSQASRLKQPPR